MKTLSSIAKLRAALWQMEVDLGLAELSQNEKDVLYAIQIVAEESEQDGLVTSDKVRRHSAVSAMTHATFHRALKRLLERGLIEHAPNTKAKLYRLSDTPGPDTLGTA